MASGSPPSTSARSDTIKTQAQIRSKIVDNQRKEAELRQKLAEMHRIVAIKNMKSEGHLTSDEIVAFIEAFGIRAEPFIRGAAFRVELTVSYRNDLIAVALAAVNRMQIECFQDGQINGKFGLMWIYKHGRKMCAESSPASAGADTKAEVDVWPKELRVAMQRHLRLVDCLVKLGHASLMKQSQSQQVGQLRIQQLRIKVAQQKLEVARLHKLALLEVRRKMQLRQGQQKQLPATAEAKKAQGASAQTKPAAPAVEKLGGKPAAAATGVKGLSRLEAELKGKDATATMALLLSKLAVCKKIVVGMTGLDAAAQAKYLAELTPAEQASMEELSRIQELLVM